MKHEELLTLENIAKLGDLQRAGLSRILVNDANTKVTRTFKSGGTKEVYDVRIGKKHYALALPNPIDISPIAYAKWSSAMMEPGKTQLFRSSGLLVNDLSKLVEVEVQDIKFPGILMKRYQDHSYNIHDAKNPESYHELIAPNQKVLNEYMFQEAAKDVITLVEEGIRIGSDSFNIASVGDSFRLYFNDLGDANFEPFKESEYHDAIQMYSKLMMRAFVNTASEASYKNPIVQKIAEHYLG